MTVGREHIQSAIEIVIEKEEPEFEEQAAGWADAGGDGLVSEQQRIAGRDIKRIHLIGEIPHRDPPSAVIPKAGGIDAHGSPRQAICVEGNIGTCPDLFESAIMLGLGEKGL